MSTDQAISGETAVETPKDDYVQVSSQPQVTAAPGAPKNEPEVETDEGEEDQEQENSDGSDGKKPRRGGFQKKIAKAEAERDFYRQRYEELERKGAGTQPKTETKSDNATSEKPDPEKFQGTTAEYFEALSDWKVAQALKAKDAETAQKSKEEKAQTELKTKVQSYQDSVAKTREAYSDYDDVIGQYADVKISPNLERGLLDSDMKAEVTYYLAKNPEEFKRLNGADSATVYRAIGKIEAKLEKSGEEVAAVRTTKAPPPITPVKARSSSNVSVEMDKLPYEEYKAKREKQRGG